MNTSRFTKIASVLAIVALIVGLSACDQVQQLLIPPALHHLRQGFPEKLSSVSPCSWMR